MITDKEKIEEIIQVSNAYQVYDVVDFDALREALREDLLEMARWKDECHKKEIEKRVEAKLKDEKFDEERKLIFNELLKWLKKNSLNYIGVIASGPCSITLSVNELVDDFKKYLNDKSYEKGK